LHCHFGKQRETIPHSMASKMRADRSWFIGASARCRFMVFDLVCLLAYRTSARGSRMFKIIGFIFLSGLWLSSFPARSSNEIHPTATPDAASKEDVMVKLNQLRDRFIRSIKADGFRTRLPAPTIVLDNPASYGNFEEDKNLLHIAVWSALTEQQQSRFERLSELVKNGKSGEQTFEESVHYWVFVHELGHWWQACQRKISNNHYSVEYGANRIAAAYWRQTDLDLMRRTDLRGIVHSLSTTAANVSDITQMRELLHGEEREVFGDQAYWSEAHRQAALAKGIRYRVNRRSPHLSEYQRFINRRRSAARARVEHVFHVVKRLWGFSKVRYRGLAKNTARLFTCFALANLYLLRRRLMPPQGRYA
jgi:IS5 family transposase